MPGPKRPGGPGGHGGPGGPKAPAKPKNTKQTFKRLFGYLKASKGLLFVVFIFVAVSSLAGIVGTYFLKGITDDYLIPLIGSELTFEVLAPLAKVLIFLACIYICGALSS